VGQKHHSYERGTTHAERDGKDELPTVAHVYDARLDNSATKAKYVLIMLSTPALYLAWHNMYDRGYTGLTIGLSASLAVNDMCLAGRSSTDQSLRISDGGIKMQVRVRWQCEICTINFSSQHVEYAEGNTMPAKISL
jgi:hypothetical protein